MPGVLQRRILGGLREPRLGSRRWDLTDQRPEQVVIFRSPWFERSTARKALANTECPPPPWSRTGWTAPVVKTVRALRLAVTGVVDQQDCPRASTQAHELGPLGQGGQGAAAVTEPHQPGEAMRSTWLSPAAIASTSRATGAGSTVPACRRGRCGGRSRTGGPDIGYRAAWWSRAMSLSITGSRGVGSSAMCQRVCQGLPSPSRYTCKVLGAG